MAASLAIHGTVLLLSGSEDVTGTAGREAMVEIEMVSASRQQAAPERRAENRERPDRVHDRQAPSEVARAEKREGVQLNREQDAGVQQAASADVQGRESIVRNHLERFKYYPASARRRGITGEVEVSFELDGRGQARLLKIMSGSGYTLLDEAALETVHRAEPFPVATGAYQFVLRFRAS